MQNHTFLATTATARGVGWVFAPTGRDARALARAAFGPGLLVAHHPNRAASQPRGAYAWGAIEAPPTNGRIFP